MIDAPTPPVFTEPWHAQLFALTVHLHDRGQFSWSDWTHAFGAKLKEHGASKSLDGGDDYFNAWLATLESLLSQADIASGSEVSDVRDAWENAYLSTPHGAPVRLG